MGRTEGGRARARRGSGTTTMRVACALAAIATLALPAVAQEADPVTALRDQVVQQRTLIQEQAALLARQERAIADLTAQLQAVSRRVGQLEQPDALVASPQPTAAPTVAHAPKPVDDQRDGVGDLNASSVAAGSFAGSILLPGSEGVSLAVGGFVKTVAIGDSAAEGMGANMLPATLGSTRPDTAGNFAIDSTVTRLHMDGRARTGAGAVRAYVEYDLNATNNGALGFKLRHAFGTWESGAGTLTAGQTWSTAMDLRILPEGLTEPTVSGPVFQRQALLRWSLPEAGGVTANLAVEDPSGTDIFSGQTPTSRTSRPDFVGTVRLARQRFHVQAGGLLRRLELTDAESGFSRAATGWGVAVSSRVDVFGGDSLAASFAHGDGMGRYILGLAAGSGAILSPDDGPLRLRQGTGGLFWYRHRWGARLRSTLGVGHARSEIFDAQPGDAFRSSSYAYGNLMWSAMRFATFGAEYSFARRTTKDGSDRDNHRVILGVQVF